MLYIQIHNLLFEIPKPEVLKTKVFLTELVAKSVLSWTHLVAKSDLNWHETKNSPYFSAQNVWKFICIAAEILMGIITVCCKIAEILNNKHKTCMNYFPKIWKKTEFQNISGPQVLDKGLWACVYLYDYHLSRRAEL